MSLPASWGVMVATGHRIPPASAKCLLSCAKDKPWVGGGVVTYQKLLGWESPIASSAQDSGHVVVAHTPLLPLPVLSQGPCP